MTQANRGSTFKPLWYSLFSLKSKLNLPDLSPLTLHNYMTNATSDIFDISKVLQVRMI